MIIVEGGDNTGKTQLVRDLLAEDAGLRLLHRKKYKPQRGETIAHSYASMILPEESFGNVEAFKQHAYSVGDRCIASECVYGELFRNGCAMTLVDHHALLHLLKSFEPVIVFCNPPDEAIMASWNDREQLYPGSPLSIQRRYRERMSKIFHGLDIIEYDWTHPSADLTRRNILETHLTQYQRFLQDLESFHG